MGQRVTTSPPMTAKPDGDRRVRDDRPLAGPRRAAAEARSRGGRRAPIERRPGDHRGGREQDMTGPGVRIEGRPGGEQADHGGAQPGPPPGQPGAFGRGAVVVGHRERLDQHDRPPAAAHPSATTMRQHGGELGAGQVLLEPHRPFGTRPVVHRTQRHHGRRAPAARRRCSRAGGRSAAGAGTGRRPARRRSAPGRSGSRPGTCARWPARTGSRASRRPGRPSPGRTTAAGHRSPDDYRPVR